MKGRMCESERAISHGMVADALLSNLRAASVAY